MKLRGSQTLDLHVYFSLLQCKLRHWQQWYVCLFVRTLLNCITVWHSHRRADKTKEKHKISGAYICFYCGSIRTHSSRAGDAHEDDSTNYSYGYSGFDI